MPPTPTEPRIPVCAIGASAGGVTASKELFRLLPSDLGLAYVVIVHLAPDQPSALADILGGVTDMPMEQVTDRAQLRSDHVYIIPPDKELVIDGDDVRARPFTEERGLRAPIDMFFRSVAEARGDGMAVILSGTGSDGSTGVRSMKEGGGVIFVQEPKSAEFRMMPQAAIAVGVADFVEPIPALAERIAEISRSKEAVRSLPAEPEDHILQRIVGFLHSRTGHDFSSYKRATVQRRVARRMQVTRMNKLGEYLDYLTENPEEAQELFGDLLISVTSFFRDPEAYGSLASNVIGPIFDDIAEREDGEIRAWVAGCATGEEAYSLAILLLEEAERRKVRVPIQIFATDLDSGALATAREGRYPSSIRADVSQERLDKFFLREGAHYCVKKEVRDTVLFAEHSILKDPPFMRLDIVTCRNLLIYLERSMQQQVSAIFAYGLKPHGYLFLGSAETIDAAGDLFTPVDKDSRIFRARSRASQKLPVISRMPAEHQAEPFRAPRQTGREEQERTVERVHREALEATSPPSVLVDRDYRVLNLSENAGRYLLPSAGPLSSDITALVRPELRLDLRTAVRRAIDSGTSSMTTPIPVAFNGSRHRVGLFVAPTGSNDGERGEALILFLDGGEVDEASEPGAGAASTDEVRRLREELNAAESRLAESKTEQENAIQDLRVANEELQSINEEYRSTSKELETSKEELQSMNEELQTVNAELKSKLESIGAAHSDLSNLVAATDVGTLFLDSKLRIRMFTPRISGLFNVTESDVGRHITDFTHRLAYETMAEDARKVLDNLSAIEHEVATRDDRWFMVRLRPYRTVDDKIDGVVATFIDVTAQREATLQMEESGKRQSFLLTLSDTLRPLSDAAEIEGEACRLLAEHFGVDRA